MPKTTITYRIFIASPNDLQEERGIVKSVSDELNNLNSIRNINLEVIGWESSTYPAMGEDAQDVINKQINDDYDIFIGIFWSRFGTETKRDKSGTKEEFERAYKRHLENPESVHILMYFKDTPIPISEIDTTQISLIQDFKKDISKRGALVGKFTQTTEFEKILRSHLSKLLNEITNQVKNAVESSTNEKSLIILEQSFRSEDDLGYLEYMDKAVKGMNDLTPILNKITKQTIDLTNRMTKRTDKINLLLISKPPNAIARESRKIIDESGNDLNIYNKNVTLLIPTLNESFNSSMNYFNKAILIHKEFLDNKGLLESLNGLKSLKDGLLVGSNGTIALNSSIKTWPPLTSKLSKAKNETITVLTNLIEELDSYINIIDNIIKVIES